VRAFRIQNSDLKAAHKLAIDFVANLSAICASSPVYSDIILSIDAFSKKHGLVEERIKSITHSLTYKSEGLDSFVQNTHFPLSLMAGLLNQYGLPHGIYFSNESA
jgi:hypothetical protein